MAESEEELKSLVMQVKGESEKVGLKLNIQKTKIMASGPITSWHIDKETVETVAGFTLGGSKITADGDSVQFSHSVMSDSLWPHELQHARPPCPSSTPGAHTNSCPSSRWCHPTISCSVIPCSSCPQSFPASGSFSWVSSSHRVAKVLEFQLQRQSFQWIFSTNFL